MENKIDMNCPFPNLGPAQKYFSLLPAFHGV